MRQRDGIGHEKPGPQLARRSNAVGIALLLFAIIPMPAFTAYAAPAASARIRGGRSYLQASRLRGLADIDRGDIKKADSLLSRADSAGALDALDLLRWMPAKAVLGKYADAGRLCCRVAAQEPPLAQLACTRLFEIIRDLPAQTRRLALESYKRCALSQDGCDTLQIKQWLSHTDGYFGLFTEQTDLLRELDSRHYPSARDFLEAASTRFSMGFFSDAVVPAVEAYRRLGDAFQKSLAATIAYQCFVRLGKTDDAQTWLPRAELTDARFKAQAVSFLQGAGLLDKADSLESTLPTSLDRDTLFVRQALFAGNLMEARQRASRIHGDRDAATVWRVRTSIFSGNAGDLEGWIDTVDLPRSGEYGREMIADRYKLELLKDAPEACRDFGALQLALWLGRPQQVTGLSFAAYPPAVRTMLACDLVAALLEKNLVAAAGNAAAQVPPGEAGPELQFYKGDILIRQDSVAQGTSVLEQILLSNPDDVFAIRAQQVLSTLGKSSRR